MNVGQKVIGGCTRCHTLSSCNIDEFVHIVLVPPQILLLHQPVDPLLNHVHLGHEVTLDRIDRLRFECLVGELLLGFHNPNDGGVKIVLAVRVNVRLRAFRFFGLCMTRDENGNRGSRRK